MQVSDWGMQLCRSTRVKILEAPQIRVDPPSATLFRGADIRIRCMAEKTNLEFSRNRLGYSWTKNNALFQSEPESEMWEDLYPDGSILKILNIQRSAIFSCAVSNPTAPATSSIQITVVEEGSITLCPEEQLFEVKWPASSSGAPVLAECPQPFHGQAKRVCEQRDYHTSIWLTPDFSDCIHQAIIQISDEVINVKINICLEM